MATIAGTGLGAAGERSYGRRDTATEVGLPLWQLVAMVVIALATCVGALVIGWAVGRRGVFALSVLGLFTARDWVVRVRRVLSNRDLAWAVRFLWYAERWVPWLWLCLGLVVLRYLMPFEWALDWPTADHFLVLLRYDELGRVANKVIDLHPVFRVLALVIGAGVMAVAGIGWRHFKNELDAFYPMSAVDPSEKGTDPRGWNRKPELPVPGDQQITVNLDIVKRDKPEAVGSSGVFTGDQIVYLNIPATRPEWQAVTRVALSGTMPTEEVMTANGFSQGKWRAMRAMLVEAELMAKVGNGHSGENAGYDFTEEGRVFFEERRWDPQQRESAGL